MNQRLNIIIYGIKIKLKRGENLEDILKSYIKLTNEEKEIIKSYFTK